MEHGVATRLAKAKTGARTAIYEREILRMSADFPTRDELAERYLAQLPYAPYPVQEDALLAWFTAEQGVLVCAPTGTGKTLIAQAALFEALHTGSVAYYTTPLIALTEQKFQEMQASAVRWGFQADDVGLVTGNRRVNPDARILVVVAEILLNRLLHATRAGLARRCAAWSRSVRFTRLGRRHGRVPQLRRSAARHRLGAGPRPAAGAHSPPAAVRDGRKRPEFLTWLERSHHRKLELVEGKERKVPLTFRWVPDEFLGDQLVHMAKGEGENRTTPALVFCFNRDECWSVAEMLKGLDLLAPGMRGRLNDEVDELDWTKGVGPKLKQMLRRGVGVHHAGTIAEISPRRRGAVREEAARRGRLYRNAGGRHQPAGALGGADLAGQGTARQGETDRRQHGPSNLRPRRPAAVRRPRLRLRPGPRGRRAHPARWKEKYDRFPEDTRDPGLLKAKKALKKKKPSRRENAVYWSESQFKQLQGAPPGKLYSKGPLPWRLLAYLLKISPEVSQVAHGAPQTAHGRGAHRGQRESARPDAADAWPSAAS